jgi:hypothetical protein
MATVRNLDARAIITPLLEWDLQIFVLNIIGFDSNNGKTFVKVIF